MTAMFDKSTLTIRLEAETYEDSTGGPVCEGQANLSTNGAIQPAIAPRIRAGHYAGDRLALRQSQPVAAAGIHAVLAHSAAAAVVVPSHALKSAMARAV